MRVASLVSGGKDSIFASWVATQWGWKVTEFLTLLPEAEAPMLFHKPNAQWVELQAQAAGVPWRPERVAQEEDESEALARLLSRVRADGITTGALASEYQRTRFERVCEPFGLKTFAPLWHHAPRRHVRHLVETGFRWMLVHTAAQGLGARWLGRTMEGLALDELEAAATKHRFNVAGEGGEYESFVVDAPHFRRRVALVATRVDERRDHSTLVIEKAELRDR